MFDDVQRVKNYNDAVLQSMTNGVLTMDAKGTVATCNSAAATILRCTETDTIGATAQDLFLFNPRVTDLIAEVGETHESVSFLDVDLIAGPADDQQTVSVNLTGVPLQIDETDNGTILLLENISTEKRVRATMARYMDPALADRLVRSDGELLGGKSSVATVLFSDIRGFTTHSERLGPQATVTMLNEYFTLMVDCIDAQGGMLDKFIGDAIMAAFGLPEPGSGDEDRGVACAIAMIRAMQQWNDQRARDGKPPIDMGIGLNTDTVVVGNIGSPKRMDFTLIGDGVNLAARLESACKQYHARILISDFTHSRLKGVYRTREIDRVIVKGKTEPVAIHEVLDYHTDATFPNLMDVVNHFRGGVASYRDGDWRRAITSFEQALVAHPDDFLSRTYIGRCEQLLADPPADWDGVWTMTSK